MWNIWKTPRLYERHILVAWLWFDSRLLLCRQMNKGSPAYWIWQQFYDWLKRNSSAQRLQDEWTNLELRNCETTLPSLFEELTLRLGFFFMLQNPRSSYFNHFGLKNFAVFKSTKLYSIWWLTKHFIQGGFFNWSALKMTKCQITCKSLQKSSKCQNFLRVWDLVIFRADQLKKPPCIIVWQYNSYIEHKYMVYWIEA